MAAQSNNYPATLLRSDLKEPPAVRGFQPDSTGEGAIDGPSFESMEVDKLFDAVNCAATVTGQATLYRSLVRPLTGAPEIRAKQDAVRELATDAELRARLEVLVAGAKRLETDFFNLLFGTFMGLMSSPAHKLELPGYGYETYQKGTRFMLDMVDAASALPVPKSAYLQGLIEELKAFRQSRAYRLMAGPVYRTEHAIITAEEKHWYTPALRFKPSLFKPVGLSLLMVVLFLVIEFVPLLLDVALSIAPALWIFLLPLSLVYIPIVGSFDRDGFIYPLRKIFKTAPEIHGALDAFGKLDELMSFVRLKDSFGHPMTLPEIADGERQSLVLKGVRNPMLAKGNADYVPNDLSLEGVRLTFITGPNSGGKTAFCKTLAQNQLLAQIGCYIAAESARLVPADFIFYQTPAISHLADGEGRFGTELRRTKDIFIAASGRSLVIMDELSEGTTHEEKIEISMNILDGFYQKGCNTVLITHNHELVDRYAQKQVGLAKQVEFRNDQPTYKLVDGISRVSHADRVAKKIGFSKDDIARYLTGKGK